MSVATAWSPGKASERYANVPFEEKEQLFREVKEDPRYEDFLYGCYECGICVSACPSARFYDFSPRVIAQTMAREDIDRFYEILMEDIWNCAQCFSCVRCPRGNNPGGLVTLMREVAVRRGLREAQQALQAYSRVIYKIMLKGNQVSPDMLQPSFFPDWDRGSVSSVRTSTHGVRLFRSIPCAVLPTQLGERTPRHCVSSTRSGSRPATSTSSGRLRRVSTSFSWK